MGKITVQKILGNLLDKLQKLYINGPRDIPAYPGMIVINLFQYILLPPQGFRPEGEIPRRHSSNSRVYWGKYLQLKYTVIQSI